MRFICSPPVRLWILIALPLLLISHTGCEQQAVTQEHHTTGGPTTGTMDDDDADDQSAATSRSVANAIPGSLTRSQAPAPARPRVQRITGGTLDITFDDLALEMPAGTLFTPELLTDRVKELDGQNVRLRGFIFAGGVFQSTGIKNFPFVMNTQCKFGPQGLAYCVILVELDEGVTADFTTYPITVEGKLSVRPYNAEGFTWSVYHLQGKRVF